MKGCEAVPGNLQLSRTAILIAIEFEWIQSKPFLDSIGLNRTKYYYLKELWVVLLVRIKLNCNCGFAFA